KISATNKQNKACNEVPPTVGMKSVARRIHMEDYDTEDYEDYDEAQDDGMFVYLVIFFVHSSSITWTLHVGACAVLLLNKQLRMEFKSRLVDMQELANASSLLLVNYVYHVRSRPYDAPYLYDALAVAQLAHAQGRACTIAEMG
ncbi:hypothetical protein Tco_0538193, partial [Tanacetum coccineum]